MTEEIILLDYVEQIAKKSINFYENGNTHTFTENLNKVDGLQKELTHICNLTGLSEKSALYLCCLIYIELNDEKSNYKLLSQHLGINRFELYKDKAYFDELKENSFIKIESQRYRVPDIQLLNDTVNAFADNNIESIKRTYSIDINTFLIKLNRICESFDHNYLSSDDVTIELNALLETFKELPIVQKITGYKIEEDWELFMICWMIVNYVNNKIVFIWKDYLKNYLIKPTFVLVNSRLIVSKNSYLFNQRLIEFCNSDFDDRNNIIKLTDLAVDVFFGNEETVSKQDFIPKYSKLIKLNDIEMKPLFFNQSFLPKYQTVEKLLEEQHYNQFTERCKELGLSESLTIILHGKPGTGKTESVYQLAKASGRELLSVNLSSIKDKFVGESEKRMQMLFNNYRAALSYFKKTPILLFNEADAILSNRIQVGSSVDAMNNNLQNILLQEIEDFKGILIATTNNIHNIDKAFDRRFLYKLNYELPDYESKQAIWQHLLPNLTKEEIMYLAEAYPLSGGQMQNIQKKLHTMAILFNQNYTLNQIIEYCDEELNFRTKKPKIGF